MKLSNLILTGVIATAFTSVSFAQTASTNTSTEVVAIQEEILDVAVAKDNGTEIKLSELPVPVQNALVTETYKDLKLKRAWIVARDGNKFYRVEVENPKAESTTILFDGAGKVMD